MPETTETQAETESLKKIAKDEMEQQQEEKSPETLEKEAVVMLDALSTPTKKKEKEKKQHPCTLKLEGAPG